MQLVNWGYVSNILMQKLKLTSKVEPSENNVGMINFANVTCVLTKWHWPLEPFGFRPSKFCLRGLIRQSYKKPNTLKISPRHTRHFLDTQIDLFMFYMLLIVLNTQCKQIVFSLIEFDKKQMIAPMRIFCKVDYI